MPNSKSRTQSKSNAAEFKRPKRMGGLRRSKNADYNAPLKRGGKGAALPYEAPTLTLQQGLLLSAGLLLFYGVICWLVIRALGWGAAFLMLGGLFILLCVIGVLLWIGQQHFWGEESATGAPQRRKNHALPSHLPKGETLPTIARIEFESELEQADYVIQPFAPRPETTEPRTTDLNSTHPKRSSKADRPNPQPSLAKRIKQLQQSSTACFRNHQYAAAIDHLHQALDLQFDLAQTHEMLGRVYLKQEDFSAAIAAFQQAITCDQTYTTAYEGLGRAYLRTGQFPEAETAFQQAIQQDAQQFRAHEGWGKVLLKQGEWAAAIEQFQRALAINPNYQAAQKFLAEAEAQKHKQSSNSSDSRPISAQQMKKR
ncbi:MAG: tetratricopeptide repeat protein [Elainella sp. Prado103]|jgi:tetratricopeptide (TPR) repeat protein|nr:tetratricopeptide repeat protein [Elainella sp. Prado103]